MRYFSLKTWMVWTALFMTALFAAGPGPAAAEPDRGGGRFVRPAFAFVPDRDANVPRGSGKRQSVETVAPEAFPAYVGDQEAKRPVRHQKDVPWRIRILETAVVDSPMVCLGQVAEPVGSVPPGIWERLSRVALWPAPPEPGRPMTLLRAKIQDFMRSELGEYEELCLYPDSMTLQVGGAVLREDALRLLVVKTLTGTAAKWGGEVEFTDFRLPSFIFLSNRQQHIEVVLPVEPSPGRVSLTLAVREMDGSLVRRFTGTVQMNIWREVPCLTRPVNRNEVLAPDMITFARRNLATFKGDVWDGRGGPYRLARSLGAEQTLMLSDLERVPTVRKGSRVNLVYERGAIRLSVPAEALADAGPGESVTVRNLQSQREILATARDSDTVVIR